jgi:hypothetical protein
MHVSIKLLLQKTHSLNKNPLNYHNFFYLITSIDQNLKIISFSDIVNKCVKVKINETVSFITDFIIEK